MSRKKSSLVISVGKDPFPTGRDLGSDEQLRIPNHPLAGKSNDTKPKKFSPRYEFGRCPFDDALVSS